MTANGTQQAHAPAVPAFLFSQAPAENIRAAVERVRLAHVKTLRQAGKRS